LGKRDLVKRIDLHNDGLFGDGSLTAARTPPKYWGTVVVAAYNSSPEGRAGADYVCDGIDDDVQINAAIASGGNAPKRIVLLSGRFKIQATIDLISDCVIEGQGDTTIVTNDIGSANNVGAMFALTTVNNVKICNLQIHNNYIYTNYGVLIVGTTTACDDIIIDNVFFNACDNLSTIRIADSFNRISIRHCRFVNPDVNESIDVFVNTAKSGRNLEIINNTFWGKTDTTPAAISIEAWSLAASVDDLLIKNVTINNNRYSGYTGGTLSARGHFLSAYGVGYMTVADNTIEICNGAIFFRDCFVISVTGNSINRCGNGIVASNLEASEDFGGARFYTISGNSIRNCAGNGIGLIGPYSSGGDDSTLANERATMDYRAYAAITGNTIRTTVAEAITCQLCANVTISGNSISDGQAGGIYLNHSWLINIAGNDLVENAYGVQLDQVYDITVVANYINNSTDYGIWLRDAYRISIRANKLYGTDANVYIAAGGVDTGATHVVIDGNSFYGGANVSYAGDVDHINLSRNTFESYSFGYGEQDENPLVGNTITNLVQESNYYTESNFIESQIRAGYRHSCIADASPGNAEFNGRSSLIQITPATGAPETDIESLTSINGAPDQIYILYPALSLGTGTATSITLLHGNNIHLAGGVDFTMDDSYDRITMHYDGNGFTELSRSKAPGYTYGSELVVNGNVETGSPANWTASGAGATWSTAQALSATHSLKINAASCSWTSDFITVSSSTNYLVQAGFLKNPAAGYTKFRVDWYTSASALISSETRQLVVVMPSWTRHQLFITSPATAAKAKLVFIADAGAPTFELYADDFSMRTYV